MNLFRLSHLAMSGPVVRGVLFLSLAFCLSAAAQESVSARVQWYGIYTAGETKEIDDPTSPTGKRFTTTPRPPASNSDRIPAQHLRFGLVYVLSGGADNKTVSVKHVYRFPPGGMPDRVAGGTRSTYEHIMEGVKMGSTTLIGWSFEGAAVDQMPLGDWTFEVWYDGRKLVEQHFTVIQL